MNVQASAVASVPVIDTYVRVLVRSSSARRHPGADPATVARQVLIERGIDCAVLYPVSSGRLADGQTLTAACAAHNELLATRWLESGVWAYRFRGTIRINVEDVDGAVREIERWRGHPRMVQIGVPSRASEHYGHSKYEPLWRAAAKAELPIAVVVERAAPASGVRYLEQLRDMEAAGVFERHDVKVVFTGHGVEPPARFTARADSLLGRVFFVQNAAGGGGEDTLMFGSAYPRRRMTDLAALAAGMSVEQQDKVLWRNASSLYGIDITARDDRPVPVGPVH